MVGINAVACGCISLVYAWGGLLKRRMVVVAAVVVHILYITALRGLLTEWPPLSLTDVPGRLTHDALWMMAAIVSSYVCFLWFINRTAAVYLKAQAEIELAQQIHHVLVPPVDIADGAIGMFESVRFSSGELVLQPGDLLALITDGVTEVFDEQDEEFGLERVKSLLATNAARPLGEIANEMTAAARAHGAQLDDQTLLLIRRNVTGLPRD